MNKINLKPKDELKHIFNAELQILTESITDSMNSGIGFENAGLL